MTFHLACVYIIFSLVWAAEWPPFGKLAAHSVDHICSRCIFTICNFSYFPFRFIGLVLGSDCFSS